MKGFEKTTNTEEVRAAWFQEMGNFVVEATANTWAVDKGKLPNQEKFKRHRYDRGAWSLRDRYSGYYSAPGMTTVYFKNRPSWYIQYGQPGMQEGHFPKAQEAFAFLGKALTKATPDLPIRGPKLFQEGDFSYRFQITDGDLSGCTWKEEVAEHDIIVFVQTGTAGLIIDKDKHRHPLFPWNL